MRNFDFRAVGSSPIPRFPETGSRGSCEIFSFERRHDRHCVGRVTLPQRFSARVDEVSWDYSRSEWAGCPWKWNRLTRILHSGRSMILHLSSLIGDERNMRSMLSSYRSNVISVPWELWPRKVRSIVYPLIIDGYRLDARNCSIWLWYFHVFQVHYAPLTGRWQ